jgi:hypothetical protein
MGIGIRMKTYGRRSDERRSGAPDRPFRRGTLGHHFLRLSGLALLIGVVVQREGARGGEGLAKIGRDEPS